MELRIVYHRSQRALTHFAEKLTLDTQRTNELIHQVNFEVRHIDTLRVIPLITSIRPEYVSKGWNETV